LSTASTGSRLHAADVGLVDVDLHFQRVHVDQGADAGAGEAAAGADRG
jgi:hypothetical protein